MGRLILPGRPGPAAVEADPSSTRFLGGGEVTTEGAEVSETGATRSSNTLLERDGLLARLEHLVDLAGDGAGSMAIIAGEAGAGKTSLMNELARRIEPRGRVLIGGCDPLATPRPLSPLMDIAADPDAHFTGHDLVESDPFSLFADVLDDLQGTIRPTLLVIEDMHWADEATLDFLRYIGRRVADTKAVVACTYREDELGPDHPLRTVLGDLATRQSTVRFSVDPLTVEAVGYLASESRYDPADLHRLTGGNAFYVTEILATGEDLPGSVSDAVMARVRRLTPPAQRVVEGVSVAPRDLVVDHAHGPLRCRSVGHRRGHIVRRRGCSRCAAGLSS